MIRPNLDIDALRTFVLGFELGSFARAADRVGRSQSAVSAQLRKLEEQVGQPLVTRAGRGLALTDAGERLLSYARRILDLNDEAVDSLRRSELAGRVRLGLPQDFAEAWLPEVLGRFARVNPNVMVEIVVEKVHALVGKTRQGDLDLSLAWGPSIDAPHLTPIAHIPTVWIGRKDWRLDRTGRREPVPLVAFESPCSFRDPAIGALDQAGLPWRIAVSSPSLSGLWAAASAGLGITMRTRIGLPAGLVALDPAATGLPALPAVSLTLVRAESEQDPTVGVLADIVLSVIGERLDAL
ncbi:LysR substrate-binding domain-containing protein [Aureimonas jatrophae]|jgi:DNA-binding transcriptional LysR family regulator|uniref:DNA-binding transcriptional regulator, LysR family n=1 Tax=Aureimonas jatrophae TaxID=1166073 RepID=A0A1H0DFU1_9HYPH|nr:LysR substrate-binding domain-containing protein [Aureimonas jatrophae]MBB3951869.1 DNA-binding transcriptional LysR family regulator [Aureimonas jatrophae]SDN69003.1 DNA-binding transcriptional regulator, LysR family [Aureimonas jatrophae]